jgi:uncharacterized protein YcbK (DUF882 family)/LysM repeat protein
MPDPVPAIRPSLTLPTPARSSRRARSPAASWASWLAALFLTAAPVYADAAEIVHVVAKGQTLGRIAKRYHTSVEALREVNGLRPGAQLHPGLSLVIPEKGKEAEAARKAAQLRGDGGDARDRLKKGKLEKTPPPGKKGGPRGKKDEADDAAPRGPKRRGFVRLTRGTEKLEIQLVNRRGHLAPQAVAGLGRILRFYPTGAKTAIDPRLAALIGEVSDHFGGRPLRVVSGFRPYTPAQYTPHSNHNVGRAMDFAVEGVPNPVVRDFCRTFRNAGVGYYPNSSFVHLDVRAGKAYWIDYSHPGEAPHYDSPDAQHSADESQGDVEPHPGAVDPAAPAPDAETGSKDTP